jgi:hypothetical protein
MVSRWAAEYGGMTKYATDLPLPSDADSALCELLSGYVLRAYHCTRLLDHEVKSVREGGLRLLTAQLIHDRIESAQRESALSDRDADCLRYANVFATGEDIHRKDQVCLVLSRLLFREDPSACERLLSTWGGEGLYRSSRSHSVPTHVRGLGRPTIVVSLLRSRFIKLSFPSLSKVFVAAALELTDRSADVFYREAVPPSHIEAILQPGDNIYEGFGQLPLC